MSMALVFTMAAGLLSGCGGNNVAEADKNTITIWHDKEDAVAESPSEETGGAGTGCACGTGKEKRFDGKLKDDRK